MFRGKNLATLAGPLFAVLLFEVLAFTGSPTVICCTASITVLVAIWWIFEPIPIPATSLIPFALFPLTGVLTHSQISHAYGHTLILLMMSGFILSTAMEKSGAHRRLALTMVRIVGGSSGKRIVLGFMIASAALSMWISNTATALMLLPIALAVLSQAKDEDRLAVPLLLGLAFAANIGGIGTPIGTPPNIIFMGAYQAHTGEEWSFARWMMIGVPILVVMLPLTWMWLTLGLRLREKIVIPHPGKWRPEEARVLAVFAMTALLWITRSEPYGGWSGVVENFWNVNGKDFIGDSTVGLLMVVVMFLVPNARGGRLLDWNTAVKIPWGLLLLYGGGMAIGMAFETSGLSQAIGSVFSSVTDWHAILMIATICLVMTFLTEVTSNTATTQLMMPILVGASIGVDGKSAIAPELLMIPAAISASFAFMLPVATPTNAIIFGTDRVSTREMVQNGFLLNLIGVVVVTVACYFLLST